MGDPFLNYFALFLLLFVVVVIFYGIIAIHDIPYLIAESRHHPHQDAIYAAGWVSLFTLHAIWPFLWIWAMAYRPDRGWGFSSGSGSGTGPPDVVAELEELRRRVAVLEGAQVPIATAGNGQETADNTPREAAKRAEVEERRESAPQANTGQRTGDA